MAASTLKKNAIESPGDLRAAIDAKRAALRNFFLSGQPLPDAALADETDLSVAAKDFASRIAAIIIPAPLVRMQTKQAA